MGRAFLFPYLGIYVAILSDLLNSLPQSTIFIHLFVCKLYEPTINTYTFIYIQICSYLFKNSVNFIQGVSRLVDITAGGDFLGPCDQKSLYKHVSDFGRLRSYGHFVIPVHALV